MPVHVHEPQGRFDKQYSLIIQHRCRDQVTTFCQCQWSRTGFKSWCLSSKIIVLAQICIITTICLTYQSFSCYNQAYKLTQNGRGFNKKWAWWENFDIKQHFGPSNLQMLPMPTMHTPFHGQ